MSDRGGILALDLSTHTGWAYGLPGTKALSGVWHLPPMSTPGATGSALIERLQDVVSALGPRLIVCEAPLPPQRQTHARTAFLQFGLAFAVELLGHWCDVRVMEERVDDVRKATLGRCRFKGGGDEAKLAVMAWVRSKGFDVDDDNRADALLLWLHACDLQKQGKVKL